MLSMAAVFSCQGFLLKLAFYLSVICMTSQGQLQENPVIGFCRALNQSPQLWDTCAGYAGGYNKNSPIVNDRAVLGYLCCLGASCASNQKNFLAYASPDYLKTLGRSTNSDLLFHAANHLEKCGWNMDLRDEFTKKLWGRKICGGFVPTGDPRILQYADLEEFMRSKQCRSRFYWVTLSCVLLLSTLNPAYYWQSLFAAKQYVIKFVNNVK